MAENAKQYKHSKPKIKKELHAPYLMAGVPLFIAKDRHSELFNINISQTKLKHYKNIKAVK